MPTTRKQSAALPRDPSRPHALYTNSKQSDDTTTRVWTRSRRTLHDMESDDSNHEYACAKKQKIRESEERIAIDQDSAPATQDESFAGAYELEHMKRLQKLNPEYNPKHNYVQHRQLLVGFIIDVCEELNLEPITIHAALNYLDRILSKLSISRRCYQLVATACICIAAKFEEQPHNIPSLSVLAQTSIAGLESKQQLVNVERILLEHLGWNALSATHLHFLQCYVARGVLFPSDTVQGKPLTAMDKRLVLRHIDFLAMLSLQDYSLLQFEQARVAAGAVAVARFSCGVEPEWPEKLAEAVGFSQAEVAECRELLWALFTRECPPSSPASPGPASAKPDSQADASLSSSPKCVVSGLEDAFGIACL